MNDEISLSVEETNKIRLRVGLRPIPISETKNNEFPQTKGSFIHELSVKETNKIRLSLGLRPISNNGNEDNKAKQEKANFEEHRAQIQNENVSAEFKAKIQEIKERSQKRRKLIHGKKLFDKDAPTKVTDDWLSDLGKAKPSIVNADSVSRVNSKAKLAESESPSIIIDHSMKELSGLGDREILTLKDSGILSDNEVEDSLSNETLSRQKKLKNDLKEKLKVDSIKETGRRFVPLSEEDNDDANLNEEKVMFSGSTIYLNENNEKSNIKKPVNKIKIDNLFSEDQDMENESLKKPKKLAKIKKFKKRGGSKTRKDTEADEDIELKHVNLENLDSNQYANEDFELESVLNLQRRIKQRSDRKNLTPEQIANEIKRVQRWETENEREDHAIAAKSNLNGGIVYDSTSDFLNSLNSKIIDQERPHIEKQNNNDQAQLAQNEKEDANLDVQIEDIPNKPDVPAFNGGLAATLNFLQSRNIIRQSTDEEAEQARIQNEAVKKGELLKLKISIEERLLREEFDNDTSIRKLSKEHRIELFENMLDARLKEKNIIMPPTDSTRLKRFNSNNLSAVNSYNPNVKLTYRDKDGNELNKKQAFKYLSHQFHGVGPNKNKSSKFSKSEESRSSSSRII